MFNDINEYKSLVLEEMDSFFEYLNDFYSIYNNNIGDTKYTISKLCDLGILNISIDSDSLYEDLVSENADFEIGIFEDLKDQFDDLLDCIDEIIDLVDETDYNSDDINSLKDSLEDLFTDDTYSKVNIFETLNIDLLDKFDDIKNSLKNNLNNISINANAVAAKREKMEYNKSLVIELFKQGKSISSIKEEFDSKDKLSLKTIKRYLFEENLINKRVSKNERQAYIKEKISNNIDKQNINDLINELMNIFGVSEKTIKRDLEYLNILN